MWVGGWGGRLCKSWTETNLDRAQVSSGITTINERLHYDQRALALGQPVTLPVHQ